MIKREDLWLVILILVASFSATYTLRYKINGKYDTIIREIETERINRNKIKLTTPEFEVAQCDDVTCIEWVIDVNEVSLHSEYLSTTTFQIGESTLDFGDTLRFEGQADSAARIFIDWVCYNYRTHIDDVRDSLRMREATIDTLMGILREVTWRFDYSLKDE